MGEVPEVNEHDVEVAVDDQSLESSRKRTGIKFAIYRRKDKDPGLAQLSLVAFLGLRAG